MLQTSNEQQHMKKKQSFLPPIKQSDYNYLISNRQPVYLENNLKKQKEILEMSVDKFSIYTKQPTSVQKIKLDSNWPKSMGSLENVFNAPLATSSTNFEWTSKQMPKLKMNKLNKASSLSQEYLMSQSERKKRLLFEQKLALEQIQMEKNYRNMRSNEYLNHSIETYKKIKRNKKIKDDQELKSDTWSSTNFKDINLNNDIINHFYSLDNRAIRHFQKYRNDFYTLNTHNRIFNDMQENNAQSKSDQE